MRPTDYTLKGALDALATGETTSVKLTEAFLDGIEGTLQGVVGRAHHSTTFGTPK